MSTEKKHIPPLRFPAFLQDGEWEDLKLGDCLLQTPDYGLNAPAVPYSETLPTYLRITDITDSGKFDKSHLTSVNAELTPENSLQEGDLVVARTGASVGKVYKYRKEDGLLVFAGFLIRLRPNPNKCNSEYLFQYMLSPSYKRWVNFTSTRSGQPGINSTEYASLPVPFPQELSEQQKIAECLSSIDSYISSINEKVEQLKAHKKSLMQKLFPQNGKTVPEYRFPEFVDNGEWEIVKLREIAIRVKNKNKFNEQLPVLTNSATEGIVNQQDYFDREIVTRDNLSNYFIVKIDDFVYNPRISSLAPVGPISRNKIERGIISPLYTIFRFCKGCIDYFDYYFRTNCWHQYLRSIANFGARFDRMNITNEEFMNMPIPFPSVAEQQKIAECLSSIDKTIGSFLEKESQIEIYKKGLMQQLFPVKK